MFGHRSFLVLGGNGPADIASLIKGGYEILDCHFSFEQGIDNRGKATTKVHGGTMQVTLSQLPPQPVIDWALDSRKYTDGAIIVVDAENIPLEKTFFKNGACVELELDYTQKGETYVVTKIVIQSEILIVGDEIDFDNEWTQ